ncbi:MAG: CoB--CoM heterodisulfide reductase iron-sulfur subunit A family protein [Chloroflexota bacterium]|nr:CoB--CoM heterodisulfide reductase iron-sulfur subunit A family protein [Chloroflexota bacterium]
MEPRVGVYICHCGANIADTVDVEAMTEFAQGLDSVVVARNYKFVCSEPGQSMIEEDIENLQLNRVVVAACSPQMHEPTFRRVCEKAGINRYLFQMANIREQCSWVTDDKEQATEKAKALVDAAVRRVAYQEPLEVSRVPVTPHALVVGGGIAGIQAALDIAEAGYKVYLVEREPSIGGHMIQLDKTFPTLDCSACILTPKMAQVRSHPNIELMTYSEVVEVSGHVGDFKVKIRRKPRYVDESKCTGCGVCIEKCPWKADSEFDMGLGKRKAIYTPFPQAVPNVPVIDRETCVYFKKGTCRACEKFCEPKAIDFEQTEKLVEVEVGAVILATGYDQFDPSPIYQYGYRRLDNVITGLEFERLCNATGPTGGRIVLNGGKEPESVAIIHCVGSRNQNYHEYCSRVCCMYSMKFAHLVREKTGAKVYEFYTDLKSSGKGYEEFYNRVLDEGVIFVRSRPPEVFSEDGKLIIQCEDTLADCQRRIAVDMVMLSTALEPRADAEEVARLFSLSRSADGFFLEKHPKLAPVATMTDGVFVVGCAQGPKDIPDTVAQASAAAAAVLAMIVRGSIEIEAATAVVDQELCSGCKICNSLCPYNAISFLEDKKVAEINEILCKGCGVCIAACPAGAITGRHFTDKQIFAEIEGLLADAKPPLVAIGEAAQVAVEASG